MNMNAPGLHEPLLEIAVAEPCEVGAPLLHRLVDGELSVARTREAAEHAQRCPCCGDHLRWLELEEQAVREIAAPTPHRFVALWSDRLRQKLVAAVSEEAGAELVHAATRSAARANGSADVWQRACDYVRQLAGWLGRDDLQPRRRAKPSLLLDCFGALLGESWPPLQEARRIVSADRSR